MSAASREASSRESLTPASRTYSNVMRRPFRAGKARHASMSSARGQRRLMGMIASRTSSVVALRETASFTGVSSPSRCITGTRPLVETVTWRCEKLGPSSESSTPSATRRFR